VPRRLLYRARESHGRTGDVAPDRTGERTARRRPVHRPAVPRGRHDRSGLRAGAGDFRNGGGVSASTAWETVIGLETHVQLGTVSKMFCGCSTTFGAPPNTNVCPVCLGLPGALPVPNERAIQLAVRAAVALNCSVHPRSVFARKNYFYPDLPKGYQISQYDQPLATAGHLSFRSPQEARAYLLTLKQVLQYVGVSECDMEKGSLRVDANVSVRKTGSTALGVKCEVKNINAFSYVEKA